MEGLSNSPEPNNEYFNDVKRHLEIRKHYRSTSTDQVPANAPGQWETMMRVCSLWMWGCFVAVQKSPALWLESQQDFCSQHTEQTVQHRVCTMQKTSPRSLSSILGKVHSQLLRNSKYLAAFMVISHCLLPPCQNHYVYSSESIKLLSSKAKNMCWKAEVH